ncbi:unnamed protein product [Bursaphelenchus okinawaensis]|uniref:Uncharacterized protein n=1 Tax=Bursaphelenchus okinawaensis TaxID=465554 RepID=A0A811LDV3_9BILA|nr:unnamed protein product [Bursaphelenchus okinawaensis]CAG9120598.1 unnamed protein product [Bursaphelenchus okinawaensis]
MKWLLTTLMLPTLVLMQFALEEFSLFDKSCHGGQTEFLNGMPLMDRCTTRQVNFTQTVNEDTLVMWYMAKVPEVKETAIWVDAYWRFDHCPLRFSIVLTDDRKVWVSLMEHSTDQPAEYNFTSLWKIEIDITTVNNTVYFYSSNTEPEPLAVPIKCQKMYHTYNKDNVDYKEIFMTVSIVSNLEFKRTVEVAEVDGHRKYPDKIYDPKLKKDVSTINNHREVDTHDCAVKTITFILFFAGIATGIAITAILLMIVIMVKFRNNRPKYLKVIELSRTVALSRYQMMKQDNFDNDFSNQTDQMEAQAKDLKAKLKLIKKKKSDPNQSNPEMAQVRSDISESTQLPQPSDIDRSGTITKDVKRKPNVMEDSSAVSGRGRKRKQYSEELFFREQPSSAAHGSDEGI